MHKSEITRTPRCMFAIDLQVEAGQTCFLHSHACTEIVWYRDCKGWLLERDARHAYQDGSVLVYQPGTEHGDEPKTAGHQICVGVSGGNAERLEAGIWQADEATLGAYEQVYQAISQHDDWRQERLDLLCGFLVLELSRQLNSDATAETGMPYHVTAARHIFDTRFVEDLSISAVAEELSINPDYLRQLFVKWLGVPPLRYLIRKRLEAACDLMRLNQQTNASIAERVGISNPFYFSRLFKQHIGVTPTEYRARHAGTVPDA